MLALRPSRWTFETSAGRGASLGPFAMSEGMFVLYDAAQIMRKFEYAGLGVGRSMAIGSLLHVPRINLPQITIKGEVLGGAGSTIDFDSYGTVFMTDAIGPRRELTPHDLEGGAVYVEGALGYLFGIGGSIMLAGMPRHMLQLSIASPVFINLAMKHAKAVVLMAGNNAGIQDSVGFNAMIGSITYAGAYYTTIDPPTLNSPTANKRYQSADDSLRPD
jgi:hypothetical protein